MVDYAGADGAWLSDRLTGDALAALPETADPEADLALLQLDGAALTPVIPLAEAVTIRRETRWHTSGHPAFHDGAERPGAPDLDRAGDAGEVGGGLGLAMEDS